MKNNKMKIIKNFKIEIMNIMKIIQRMMEGGTEETTFVQIVETSEGMGFHA